MLLTRKGCIARTPQGEAASGAILDRASMALLRSEHSLQRGHAALVNDCELRRAACSYQSSCDVEARPQPRVRDLV